jgi:hypothetical protein
MPDFVADEKGNVVDVRLQSVALKPKPQILPKLKRWAVWGLRHVVLNFAFVVVGALIFFPSLSAYEEAESHLTPKSVSVSGYYRRDGTYVRPYKRRPPGGAIHDAPYEREMSRYFFLMIIGGLIAFVPVGRGLWFSYTSYNELFRQGELPPVESEARSYPITKLLGASFMVLLSWLLVSLINAVIFSMIVVFVLAILLGIVGAIWPSYKIELWNITWLAIGTLIFMLIAGITFKSYAITIYQKWKDVRKTG